MKRFYTVETLGSCGKDLNTESQDRYHECEAVGPSRILHEAEGFEIAPYILMSDSVAGAAVIAVVVTVVVSCF